MLVLTRRAGESVVIGSTVVVTVVEVRGDVVRVGIDAPREVQVHREEVFRAVSEANRAAASATGSPAALEALRRRLSGTQAGTRRPARGDAPPPARRGGAPAAAPSPTPSPGPSPVSAEDERPRPAPPRPAPPKPGPPPR